MKIFCDLDGTLIDVAPRHYRVYSETVRELQGNPIDQKTYWDLKRHKSKWSEILPMSQLSPDLENAFLGRFIRKIEDPEYLKMDTLFPGAIESIEKLRTRGECYLVTLRRNRTNLLEELDRLDITRHFTEVLTGHSENDGSDVKIALIKDKLNDDQGIIIGDTEADILSGKELGLKTFAVTSGIRESSFLSALQPDHIATNITHVAELL